MGGTSVKKVNNQVSFTCAYIFCARFLSIFQLLIFHYYITIASDFFQRNQPPMGWIVQKCKRKGLRNSFFSCSSLFFQIITALQKIFSIRSAYGSLYSIPKARYLKLSQCCISLCWNVLLADYIYCRKPTEPWSLKYWDQDNVFRTQRRIGMGGTAWDATTVR